MLPNGTPIGQIINEKTLRNVSNVIKNHMEPKIYLEIKIVYLNDRLCVHVKFEGVHKRFANSEKIYFFRPNAKRKV